MAEIVETGFQGDFDDGERRSRGQQPARFMQPAAEFPAKGATKVFTDIGQGNIRFDEVLKVVDDVKYTGAVVYNCRNSYDVYRSILRTRSYINQVLVPNGFQED